MKLRFFFDLAVKVTDKNRLQRLHGSVQDALADVFMEEGLMPKDGVRMIVLSEEERKRNNGEGE